MRYDIFLAPEAFEDLHCLTAKMRVEVQGALERYLRHTPTGVGKSRIKRLRGLSHPQFRLRVGADVRVFYDVTETTVQILAIILKSDAEAWLERSGEPDEEGGSV
ncbi:MAG: type II toxin-antitoxin system RelE/ParE family toxin [Planctomycetaceae bacterium]|nr:type II toxin-antitoxin system RelE/ParE family toxin [Planctomycetaceae bacterium]